MEKQQMFQWIRGDQMGKIVKAVDTIVDDNMEFFVFEDGSQCNTQLVNEWIVPIENAQSAPYLADPEPVKPPKQEAPAQKIAKESPVDKLPRNPVFDLLIMSKKKKTKIEISLELEMPSDELIKVIVDSYDGGDTHIADYLVASINMDSVMKKIQEIAKQRVDQVAKKKRVKNEQAI